MVKYSSELAEELASGGDGGPPGKRRQLLPGDTGQQSEPASPKEEDKPVEVNRVPQLLTRVQCGTTSTGLAVAVSDCVFLNLWERRISEPLAHQKCIDYTGPCVVYTWHATRVYNLYPPLRNPAPGKQLSCV